MLDGRPIYWSDLRPALSEAAGGIALEEAILDRLLAREAESIGVAITPADIDREQTLLLDSFRQSGLASTTDEAAGLLRSIRRERGLGESRYASLLRRNAILRAIVAPRVVVTPDALNQAYEYRFGERYRARLIVVPSLAAATEALRRLERGEDFSSLAAEVSIDSSAERGGVLEPISPADPAYPLAVRSALRALSPGGITSPIAVDRGYAVLRLDAVLPASSPPPARPTVEAMLELEVRLQQERLLMNQLVRSLLERARVTVLDRVLDEVWRARTSPD